MMKRPFLFSLLLVVAVVQMSAVVVMSAAATPSVEPACPTVVQRGAMTVTIPAGSTSVTAEQPIIRCVDLAVQVTGGTMNRTPVIINAVVHHDQLLVTANLLAPQPGPTDVTLWWRAD